MAYVSLRINALISLDPDQAREEILKALRAKGMHKNRAAKKLGCTYATLIRWIERLSLDEQVDKLKATAIAEGWYKGYRGGRPLGSTVANGASPRPRRKISEVKVRRRRSQRVNPV